MCVRKHLPNAQLGYFLWSGGCVASVVVASVAAAVGLLWVCLFRLFAICVRATFCLCASSYASLFLQTFCQPTCVNVCVYITVCVCVCLCAALNFVAFCHRRRRRRTVIDKLVLDTCGQSGFWHMKCNYC